MTQTDIPPVPTDLAQLSADLRSAANRVDALAAVPAATPPAPEDAQAARRHLLSIVLAGIDAGLAAPEAIYLYDFGTFQLQLDDNQTAALQAWAARLGIEPPTLGKHVNRTGTPTREYKTSAWHDNKVLPGWSIELSCRVVVGADGEPVEVIA